MTIRYENHVTPTLSRELAAPVTLRHHRLVVAGPTCGKTHIASELVSRGLTVIDTDRLVDVIAPWWFDYQPEEADRDRALAWLDRQLGARMRALLDAHPNAVGLTNMWGPAFIEELGRYAPGGRLPISVFRSSAAEVSALIKKRGSHAIPTAVVQRWTDDWTHFASQVFVRTYWLDPIELGHHFLGDAITFERPDMLPPLKAQSKDEMLALLKEAPDGN